MPTAAFQRYLRVLLPVALALLAVVAALNFAVDPLQYFRPASFYAPHYSSNQRYQAPALARTYAYDTVVIGNSHAANLEKPYLEQVLGGTALNLTMEGSSSNEQAVLLRHVLAQGKVQRVLWVIDFGAFSLAREHVDAWTASLMPMHLYRHPLRAAGPYLLSWDTLLSSLHAVSNEPQGRPLEALNSWWREHEFSRARVEAAWDHAVASWTPAVRAQWERVAADRADLEQAVAEDVLAQARAHPEVRFDLVLPPYSLFDYAADLLGSPQRLLVRLQLAEVVAQAARRLPNVHVWDLQGYPGLVDDPSRYKDTAHFDKRTSDLIIDTVAGRRALPDGVDLPTQLLAFLDRQCAGDAAERARFCPAGIECGRQQLRAWLRAGRPMEWQGRCPAAALAGAR